MVKVFVTFGFLIILLQNESLFCSSLGCKTCDLSEYVFLVQKSF